MSASANVPAPEPGTGPSDELRAAFDNLPVDPSGQPAVDVTSSHEQETAAVAQPPAQEAGDTASVAHDQVQVDAAVQATADAVNASKPAAVQVKRAVKKQSILSWWETTTMRSKRAQGAQGAQAARNKPVKMPSRLPADSAATTTQVVPDGACVVVKESKDQNDSCCDKHADGGKKDAEAKPVPAAPAAAPAAARGPNALQRLVKSIQRLGAKEEPGQRGRVKLPSKLEDPVTTVSLAP